VKTMIKKETKSSTEAITPRAIETTNKKEK
jgi:hypothetical protein